MCVISGDYLSKEGFAFHIEAANVTGRLFMSNLFLHNPSDATRGGGIRAAAGLGVWSAGMIVHGMTNSAYRMDNVNFFLMGAIRQRRL